jgi:hypothetical protein
MDPLALLSNLHGDGPSTLQRLRRYGCDTLAGLLASPPGELAPILGWEPARTERFLREAEVLARRLGDGLLDVEEDASEPVAPEPKRTLGVLDEDDEDDEDDDERAQPGAADVAPAAPERAAAEDAGVAARAAVDDEAATDDEAEFDGDVDDDDDDDEVAAELPVELREEILTRWRTLDASVPQADERAAPHAPDTLVPRAARRPPAAGRPLAAAGIDGLDPVRIRALQHAGIATVEALAAADDLEVHRATGLSYTVASRLTFLARRAAAKTSPVPARPPAGRGDVGGPFA